MVAETFMLDLSLGLHKSKDMSIERFFPCQIEISREKSCRFKCSVKRCLNHSNETNPSTIQLWSDFTVALNTGLNKI